VTAVLCRIKWHLPEYTGEEDAVFLLGETDTEFAQAEDDVAEQIKSGALDENQLREAVVIEIHPMSWKVVRTGQRTTEFKFVVVTPTTEHTYIRRTK